jgi:hypothetical protein
MLLIRSFIQVSFIRERRRQTPRRMCLPVRPLWLIDGHRHLGDGERCGELYVAASSRTQTETGSW